MAGSRCGMARCTRGSCRKTERTRHARRMYASPPGDPLLQAAFDQARGSDPEPACAWASSSRGGSRSAPSRTSSTCCGSRRTRATVAGRSFANGPCSRDSMDAVDVELRGGGPARRAAGRSDRVRLPRRRRRPGRRDRATCTPTLLRFLQRAAAARVPLVGVCTGAFILHRAGLMDGLPLLRQLVPPRRFPGAVRRADAGLGPDLRRRPRPADVLRRGELGASRGLHRREATSGSRRAAKEPAHHDHRRGAGGQRSRSRASRWTLRPRTTSSGRRSCRCVRTSRRR